MTENIHEQCDKMTTERFELHINNNDNYDIIDWIESKEKDAICIYNDVGNRYYSSAPALCTLLNNLNNEKDYWKKRALLLEQKYGELPPKVELKDIIGLIKTEETTNSVELKKELYK